MYEEMAFKMGPQNRSLTRRFEATSTQGKGALKRKDLDGKSKELKGQSLWMPSILYNGNTAQEWPPTAEEE